jgi:hypothetical protein
MQPVRHRPHGATQSRPQRGPRVTHQIGQSERVSEAVPADPVIAAAFPRSLEFAVADPLFQRCTLPSDLEPSRRFTVAVDEERLQIPYRIYNSLPPEHTVAALQPEQRTMLACLFTRHHDGHVRQQRVQLVMGATRPWVVPFVVRLLGEYVVEIAEAIRAALPTDPEARATYVQFVRANQEFLRGMEARATSYWDCYYRSAYPDRAVFPALIALAEIASWEHA